MKLQSFSKLLLIPMFLVCHVLNLICSRKLIKINYRKKSSSILDNSRASINARYQFGVLCNGPSYSHNIYDSAGIYHNMVLEATERDLIPDSIPSLDYSVNAVNMHCENLFLTDYPEISSYEFTPLNVGEMLADSGNSFKNVIEATDLSRNVKTYCHQLVDLIEDKSNYSGDYCTIKEHIIDLENTVLSDDNLSELESGQILFCTSIARHSVFYWYNYALTLDPDVEGRLGFSKNGHSQRNVMNWLEDHLGGIIGGAIGDAVGAVIGAGRFVSTSAILAYRIAAAASSIAGASSAGYSQGHRFD